MFNVIYILNGMYVVVLFIEDFFKMNIIIGSKLYILNDLILIVLFQVSKMKIF